MVFLTITRTIDEEVVRLSLIPTTVTSRLGSLLDTTPMSTLSVSYFENTNLGDSKVIRNKDFILDRIGLIMLNQMISVTSNIRNLTRLGQKVSILD